MIMITDPHTAIRQQSFDAYLCETGELIGARWDEIDFEESLDHTPPSA